MSNELIDDYQFESTQPERISFSKSWLILLLVHFTLFGAGLWYADKSCRRYWLYIFCALYAWASFANVFIEVSKSLERFHNTTAEGSFTIFIGWGIAYIVGGIDALITFGMRKNGR
ncbi:MAG TPA: hypothetical protein VK151_04860 [Fluviicola sp.]|nr:hypothetical protein [Fluviicola sp.]